MIVVLTGVLRFLVFWVSGFSLAAVASWTGLAVRVLQRSLFRRVLAGLRWRLNLRRRWKRYWRKFWRRHPVLEFLFAFTVAYISVVVILFAFWFLGQTF